MHAVSSSEVVYAVSSSEAVKTQARFWNIFIMSTSVSGDFLHGASEDVSSSKVLERETHKTIWCLRNPGFSTGAHDTNIPESGLFLVPRTTVQEKAGFWNPIPKMHLLLTRIPRTPGRSGGFLNGASGDGWSYKVLKRKSPKTAGFSRNPGSQNCFVGMRFQNPAFS